MPFLEAILVIHMRTQDKESLLADMQPFMRELRIRSVTHDGVFTCRRPRRGLLSPLHKGHRIVDRLCRMGGIITGSRALKYHRLGDRPLLDREPGDWDILVDKATLYRFCAETGMTGVEYHDDRLILQISTGLYTGLQGYTSRPSYLFRHDIDLMAREDLPPFVQCGPHRVATVESVLATKMRSVEMGTVAYEQKHMEDCFSVMAKFRAHGLA